MVLSGSVFGSNETSIGSGLGGQAQQGFLCEGCDERALLVQDVAAAEAAAVGDQGGLC